MLKGFDKVVKHFSIVANASCLQVSIGLLLMLVHLTDEQGGKKIFNYLEHHRIYFAFLVEIFIIYGIKLTKSWPVKRVPLVRPLEISILVQHAVREELDLMSIPQSILNLFQDPTVKQQAEDNCGFLDQQDADEFVFSAGEKIP